VGINNFAVAGPSTWNSLPDSALSQAFSGVSWKLTFCDIDETYT